MLKRLRALSTGDIIRITIAVVISIILGVSILINYDTRFGQFMNTVGIAGAIMAFLFSFINFLNERFERQRLSERITVCFRNFEGDTPEDKHVLPFSLRRGNFTRAELLGYIGMIPKHEKGQRFDIHWLSTRAFFDALETIQEGSKDQITIYCTAEEYAKFDFNAADALDAPDADQDTTPAPLDKPTDEGANEGAN